MLIMTSILACLSAPGAAEGLVVADLQFKPVKSEGLNSLSIITATAQDAQGFMWFGGKNGIARFDGYQSRHFRHDPANPNSVSSNDISDFLIDGEGRLWIATLSGGGLNRFEGETESFIRYQFDPNRADGIGSDSVYALAKDIKGHLWLATHDNGLNKFDSRTETFRHFPKVEPQDGVAASDLSKNKGPSENTIRDLSVDSKGIFWLATQSEGVNRFDPNKEIFTHLKVEPETNTQPQLYSILASSDGAIWVGSYSNGLYRLDDSGRVQSHYEFDRNDPHSLGSGIVWDIMEDNDGQIWVATGSGHLNRFDREKNRFDRLFHNKYDPKTPSNTITKLFQDNSGDYWFGSYFSTVDYVNTKATLFSVLDLSQETNVGAWPKNITAMARDNQGNLWMVTDAGLSHYDFSDKSLNNITSTKSADIYRYPIRSILVDTKNRVWLGALGSGIYVLDKDENILAHYDNDDGLKDNKIWSIYEDSAQTIWVGTQMAGLAKFDEAKGVFEHFPITHDKPGGLSNGFVWDIKEERGAIWVATQWGLNRFDSNTGVFTHFFSDKQNKLTLSSSAVKALAFDDEGDLWVATSAGLSRYDLDAGQFDRVGNIDNLVDDNITSVLAFGNDIWFSTQKGLSFYNPALDKFFEFDVRHGVNGKSFVRKTGLVLKQDTLAFGGVAGVTLVHPARFQENDHIPEVAFTDFRINHESVPITKDGPLRKSITVADAVFLQPEHLFFSIEFAALSYRVPDQNQYAYKLQGFDKKWHSVGAENRRVTYTNLDPGEYMFLVKAANHDGLWNDSTKALMIHIEPSWWQTMLARALMMLAVLVFVYWLVNLQVGRIRHRQVLLKTLVEKKTRELASANESIRQLNLDLEARVDQRTFELSVEVEERRHAEAKLYHMAFHDALTELPNRYWLIQELKKRIETLKGALGYKFALLFLDGDRFKLINDTHGHVLGDQLLVAAARRLKLLLPEHHHVVRLGGDEFTVLIDHVIDATGVTSISKKIITAFEEPFFIEQNKVFFKVSIGILICEELYSKPEQILRDADIALYRAKDKGRGTFQIFDSKMREETIELTALERDLHSALQRNELFMEYQPIVNLNSGRLEGFEALLRWHHPEKGLISPDKFIPIAEESSLIGMAGLKAMDLVCAQLARWKDTIDQLPKFSVSVNVSSLQIAQADLFDNVDAIMRRWDIDGRHLKLEITESALMEKSESVTELLEAFRERGLELAIDDFGTGYSSLSYLDQLPVQVLKIDRSFVSGLIEGQSEGGAIEIVRATISLAHNLRMKVVAEGIETLAQLQVLTKAGCDFGQGFWFAKPLSQEKAGEALALLVDQDMIYLAEGLADLHNPRTEKRTIRNAVRPK